MRSYRSYRSLFVHLIIGFILFAKGITHIAAGGGISSVILLLIGGLLILEIVFPESNITQRQDQHIHSDL